jgi:hypothetical protein
MLSVVKIVNRTRGWYESGAAVRRRIVSEKAEAGISRITPQNS